MKICFVIPTLTSGGAERVAVTVLSALDARHERVLYLFSGKDGVYFDRVDPAVRVVIAAHTSWLGRMWELSRFLRGFRPDVVMPFLSYFIVAVAVRFAGIRARVIFNQGTPTTGFLADADFGWRQPWRRRLFIAMTRFFYTRADAVVATSAGVADDLVANYRVPRSRIRILHNPVDLDAIAELSRQAHDEAIGEGPIIAAAGRLAGVKNYPLLIAAVAEVAATRPVTVWILGEGPEQPRLEELARAKGVAPLVKFFGFQANPWRFIARADVFVLTSTYEGFGNVLIEAMACGTPVVATLSPGTTEIIEDSANGLLVAHEPGAVAAAIRLVLDDATLRERLTARARVDVGQYDVPVVAGNYERLFQEVTA